MQRSFVIFLFVLIPLSSGFRQQSVGIRGRLMCGSTPAANTKVKLWNKNKLGTDDLLAETKTDNYGNYQIAGGVGSIFSMDVHVKFYTDCARTLPCQRKIELIVPESYVTRTRNVQRWLEGGTLNLEFRFPQEETSCIN